MKNKTGPLEQGCGGGGGGSEGASAPSKLSLLMRPVLQMSPLNVLFLKEVTKNVHEN